VRSFGNGARGIEEWPYRLHEGRSEDRAQPHSGTKQLSDRERNHRPGDGSEVDVKKTQDGSQLSRTGIAANRCERGRGHHLKS